MHRVGFLPRLAAFLIDLGIFTAAVHLFTLVDVLVNLGTPLNNFGVVSLLGGSLLLIGYGLFEVALAATPGKKLAGLTIAGDDGRPASRATLLKRWAAKHIPVFFAAPMAILWTLLSPYNYHVALPDYVVPGLFTLAVIDTILTGILLLMVVGGCFLALLPARTALHDKLSHTAVYEAADLRARQAFEVAAPHAAVTASARKAHPISPVPQTTAPERESTSV